MDIATVGAYGAIPLRISPTSMARCLGTGTVEMMIPETVYIEINGSLKVVQTLKASMNFYWSIFMIV